MTATAMNHFTILTDQLDQTVSFYKEILQLEEGYRPPLGFPGAWMYTGGAAVLLRRQNESNTWQLFCFDPSGAKVELDFDPSETAPEQVGS